MCSGCTERLVTVAQIGRALGIPRAEAERLTLADGFPPVVAEVRSSSPPYGSAPLWRWADVRRWAAAADVSAAA